MIVGETKCKNLHGCDNRGKGPQVAMIMLVFHTLPKHISKAVKRRVGRYICFYCLGEVVEPIEPDTVSANALVARLDNFSAQERPSGEQS